MACLGDPWPPSLDIQSVRQPDYLQGECMSRQSKADVVSRCEREELGRRDSMTGVELSIPKRAEGQLSVSRQRRSVVVEWLLLRGWHSTAVQQLAAGPSRAGLVQSQPGNEMAGGGVRQPMPGLPSPPLQGSGCLIVRIPHLRPPCPQALSHSLRGGGRGGKRAPARR